MPREKKESRNLNIRLDKSIHDDLDKFCGETGMQKTQAVEKILKSYFGKYFSRPEKERTLF